MRRKKADELRKRGWKIGSAGDFLKLSREEQAYIEIKIALVQKLRAKRKGRHLTQKQLADLVHSSQSRVAKMENDDPTVSIDLLLKSLLALGTSPDEVAQTISFSKAA